MNFPSSLKKIKIKRILTLSAGTVLSGIHSSFVETGKNDFEVIGQAFLPYPPSVQAPINELLMSAADSRVPLSVIAFIDRAITQLFIECGKTTLAQSLKRQGSPHLMVLNKLNIWNGTVAAGGETKPWNIALGDGQMIASALDTPTVTDLTRHALYEENRMSSVRSNGFLSLAKKTGDFPVFVNIGLFSHITFVNKAGRIILADSDTGPGSCLINIAAAEAGVADGFDRDGSFASTGTARDDLVESFCEHEWFRQPSPKSASILDFNSFLENSSLQSLPAPHKMATITALTARSIFDFCRREKILEHTDGLWISGGGTYNQTLMEYLKSYFGSTPVHSIEELHINPESCVPLTLALAISSFIDGSFRNSPTVDQKSEKLFFNFIYP